jgi:hypothetical protein
LGSSGGDGDDKPAIGDQFVQFLENSLLENEVRDIIAKDEVEEEAARKQKQVDQL